MLLIQFFSAASAKKFFPVSNSSFRRNFDAKDFSLDPLFTNYLFFFVLSDQMRPNFVDTADVVAVVNAPAAADVVDVEDVDDDDNLSSNWYFRESKQTTPTSRSFFLNHGWAQTNIEILKSSRFFNLMRHQRFKSRDDHSTGYYSAVYSILATVPSCPGFESWLQSFFSVKILLLLS